MHRRPRELPAGVPIRGRRGDRPGCILRERYDTVTQRRGIRSARIAVAVFLVLVGGGITARGAAEESPGAEPTPSPWELEVLPYAWVPGTYGSLEVAGHRVDIDVTPNDVLNLLFDGNAFAASGYFSLTYDRFSVF